MTAELKGAGHPPPPPPADDTWLKPPPHFKEKDGWSRHPQSNEEWNAHSDEGDRTFRAKRRLAFAGDLADPRAAPGMALVSRLDVNMALSRLTWLEARFENTKGSALPPPPIDKKFSYITPRKSWPRPATPTALAPAWAGEFVDFNDWVNKATTRLTGTYDQQTGIEIPSVCIDNVGRRCTIGAHFMRARDEGTFPVRFFWDCAPDEQPGQAAAPPEPHAP